MSEVKNLIERIVASRGCEDRLRFRATRYDKLAKYANLPTTLQEISNDQPPWYCHGLAFRMATYSSEDTFARLNDLLGQAENSSGWEREYQEWNSENDHWAARWDKFFHFLWMLQCYEYFHKSECTVTFPLTNIDQTPDLKIKDKDGDCLYAECRVYSKWWFNEIFLDDLLRLIDENLMIRRIHNLRIRDSSNPLSNKRRCENLELIAQNLSKENIEKAQDEAAKKSPYTIFENEGLEIIIHGEGEYNPDVKNAQGDPRCSLKAYLRKGELTGDKNKQLEKHHPNILMVNGLGDDFQAIFRDGPPKTIVLSDARHIDSLWIAACGIDELLKDCSRIWKISR